MKQKNITYLHLIFLLFSFDGFFAQDLSLKISSTKKTEILILDEIDYQKKFKDSISLYSEVNKMSGYLKNIGYFTNSIDSIKKNKNNYTAFFSLNQQIKKAILKIDNHSDFLFKTFKINKNTISIPIEKLQSTLSSFSEDLEMEGKSFSKVQLKNISINNKILFAELEINQSKKRNINKVIIKGYENFPKSYLKNYFNIRPNTVFNQQKIKKISDDSKNLKFVREIKPPEVLFTKDSTLIYMYLKKHQNNSFDGIVNFASKENGDILFNGNINLKLNNILNTGEQFELFWNSIGEERQEFKLFIENPYLFNSKITPQLSFSIYKQDSTFLNTKFDSKLFYNLNTKTKLALTYSSESSENLKETIDSSIETYDNYFLGFLFEFKTPKGDLFFNDKFHFEINPTFGKRKTNQSTSTQFKIETSSSFIFDLNSHSNICIKNTSGYLNSESFIDNELFRIGGANSIRGYNEQSIFTNSYTFFNLEYRYLTSKNSFLYSITDFGSAKINTEYENLFGIGLGYKFMINNSQINIGSAMSENDFNKMKIILSWRTIF